MPANTRSISEITTPAAPDRTVFGRVTYAAGETLGPRRQDGLQLVGIEAGWALITVDSRKHRLEAGQMCLLRPVHREHFRFASDQPTRHNWATMTFSAPADFDAALAPLPFATTTTPMIESLIEWGLAAYLTPGPTARQLSNHLGQSLFHAWVLAAQSQQTLSRLTPPPVERARQCIARCYNQPLAVDDLARAASVSTNHLTRLFKQHLATTPSRYLWRYRTDKGVDLLRHTGLTVAEIADRTGFSTPFHFSRMVKQIHGLAPRQLRARFWKLD